LRKLRTIRIISLCLDIRVIWLLSGTEYEQSDTAYKKQGIQKIKQRNQQRIIDFPNIIKEISFYRPKKTFKISLALVHFYAEPTDHGQDFQLVETLPK
jgi:hypothetical protein